MEKSEAIFYNINIFKEEEDLIVFPYEEFLKGYDETTAHLRIMGKILREALADPPDDPAREFEILEAYLDRVSRFMDPLLKFETQTTLESFAGVNHQEKKSKYKEIYNKGDLQCLIGLNGSK